MYQRAAAALPGLSMLLVAVHHTAVQARLAVTTAAIAAAVGPAAGTFMGKLPARAAWVSPACLVMVIAAAAAAAAGYETLPALPWT
jgi:hypothetical protein